jgi:membrane protein implicated in regulation of membrane protease activity
MLQNIISFIFAWYNLPFTVLLVMGLLLTGLQFMGLGGDAHEGDVDHDVDLDHGVDLDHDVDLDHGIDLDHHIDIDHDVDLDHGADIEHGVDHDVDHEVGQADGGGGDSSILSLMAFLGFGKAPLMVVLLLFFDMVALFGWMLNGLVGRLPGAYPAWAIFLVLPLAVIGGSLVTSRTARLIGQVLPPISTTASRAEALVGMRGTVISPFVDDHYGLVHLRNPGGTLISVFVYTRDTVQIQRGDEVILLAYESVEKRYLVTKAKAG